MTTRREFLGLTSSLALTMGGLCFSNISEAFALNQAQLFLALCDTGNPPPLTPDAVTVTDPGSIRLFNLASKKVQAIPLPFFGHAVTQNPQQPNHLVTFEKWGKRAALVDLRASSIIATAEPLEGNIFFGHAVYTPDGSMLINTESADAPSGGQIVFRDPLTLKIIKTEPSFGRRPHECLILKNSQTLLVANEGSGLLTSDETDLKNPVLAWIDLQSGRLQHRTQFIPDGSKNLSDAVSGGYAHILSTFDGWVICGGAKDIEGSNPVKDKPYAMIAFVSPEGEVFEPELSDDLRTRMRGEALSLCVLGESGLAAVTIPAGNMCFIFDYKTQKLLHVIDTPDGKGAASIPSLVTGHESFVISSARGFLKANFGQDGNGDISVFSSDFRGHGSHISLLSI